MFVQKSASSFSLPYLDPFDFQFEWTCFFVTKQDAKSVDLTGIEWLVLNDTSKRRSDEFIEGQCDLDPFVFLGLKVGTV